MKRIILLIFLSLIVLSPNNYAQSPSSNIPLKNYLSTTDISTNLTKFLNKESWNKLFPHRYGIGLKDTINNKNCMEACLKCAAICNHRASACTQEEDVKMMAKCIQLNRICLWKLAVSHSKF